MTRLISEWLRDSREEQREWQRRVLVLTDMTVIRLAQEAAMRWGRVHRKISVVPPSSDKTRKLSAMPPSSDETRKMSAMSPSSDETRKRPVASSSPDETKSVPGTSPSLDGSRPRCAVVRVTAGQGVISGFSESIGATLDLLGAEVMIPVAGDAQGIHEAVCRNADLIWLADDDRFIVLNIKTGTMGENDAATAWGYTAALNAMAGGLSGKDVLLMGCGRVGREARDALKDRGARVFLYDRNSQAACALASGETILNEKAEIRNFKLIFDATDEGGWLSRADLHDDFLAAAPGIPLSFDDECVIISRDRIYHDPLQTGTAVMLFMAMGSGSDGSHRL